MRFKKLVCVMLALAMFAANSVSVSADTFYGGIYIGSYAQLSTYSDYSDYFNSLGTKNFSDYLNYFLSGESRKDIPMPTVTLGSSYNFPTLLTKAEVSSIASSLRNNATIQFPIDDPVYGITYTASLTKDEASALAKGMPDGGKVNLALYIDKSYNKINFYSTGNNSVRGKISYGIVYLQFNNLIAGTALAGNDLTLTDGNGAILKTPVNPGYDASFYLSSGSDWSVAYTVADNEDYFNNAAAEKWVQEQISKYLDNLSDKEAEALAKKIQDKLTGNYYTEEELEALFDKYIKNYFYNSTNGKDNLETLVEAIFDDEEMQKLIEDKINEIIKESEDDGYTLTEKQLAAIGEYIIKLVTDQIFNTSSNTNAKLIEKLIAAALQKQFDDLFGNTNDKNAIEKLLNAIELLEVIKGEDGKDGKDGENGLSAYELAVANGFRGTFAEWLESLQGEDGKNGTNGQSFYDWAVQNYGSIDNFINSVSFEGWARKYYGSVDNFIRSITGANGMSAYELAVSRGYSGTLSQWLESLQGEDGLSAYEVAVENGFRGSEVQWLESLQGADGEDGEDGQDGKDGQDGRDAEIVYVNAGNNNSNASDSVGSANDKDDADVIFSAKGDGSSNPSTGAAVGLILPAAAGLSVLLVKKSKRRRGRK